MRNLLPYLNDPDVQDYLGMINARRRWPPQLYTGMPNEPIVAPIWAASPNPNLVTADYTGVGGRNQWSPSSKQLMTKRAGMTNREVDELNRMGVSVTPRNVTRTYEDKKARKTRAGLAGYSPTNRSIPITQVSRSFYDDKSPNRAVRENMYPGGRLPSVRLNPQAVPFNVGNIDQDPTTVKPGRGTEAVEGPELGFSKAAMAKAAEMIAASQRGAPTARPFVTRMGTRKYEPYRVASSTGKYASPYLRRREEEEVV